MSFFIFQKPGNLRPATADLATELGRLMRTQNNATPLRLALLERIYNNLLPNAKARCDAARGKI